MKLIGHNAKRMGLPSGRNMQSPVVARTQWRNSTVNTLKAYKKIFERYGLRFLTADEIRKEMPEYPL
jgi:hypothetical protein